MDEEVKNEVVEEMTETENTEAQTAEEIEDGIELVDTTEEKETETEKEQPKGRFVTDEELNSIVDRRVARKMKKLERENDVYKDTENVLKTALGVNDINSANQKLREYYTENGVKLPDPYKTGLSERQIDVLAKADAEEFIEDGYEAMIEEANRLATIGYNNLDPKDKKIFLILGEELEKQKELKELKGLGVTDEFVNDKSFIEFKKKFDKNTPVKDIYDYYQKLQPKKEVELPGSMKNNSAIQKDKYTQEEISRLTSEELDDPIIWEKVKKSLVS